MSASRTRSINAVVIADATIRPEWIRRERRRARKLWRRRNWPNGMRGVATTTPHEPRDFTETRPTKARGGEAAGALPRRDVPVKTKRDKSMWLWTVHGSRVWHKAREAGWEDVLRRDAMVLMEHVSVNRLA